MFFESILDVKVHVYYYVLGACSTVPSRTTNESDDKFQSCESCEYHEKEEKHEK